ncbi:MAG: type II toxin-antitoxin system RelE/ParE family toxin [Sphingomonadaceae bacterium]
MPTHRIILSNQAARDIDTISDQTITRWGKQQARKYVSAIRADIESLRSSPRRFPMHECNSLGLRRMRSGHHLVFFSVGEDVVHVIRVLHERMDVDEVIL